VGSTTSFSPPPFPPSASVVAVKLVGVATVVADASVSVVAGAELVVVDVVDAVVTV